MSFPVPQSGIRKKHARLVTPNDTVNYFRDTRRVPWQFKIYKINPTGCQKDKPVVDNLMNS
jgi:hypothetical protein